MLVLDLHWICLGYTTFMIACYTKSSHIFGDPNYLKSSIIYYRENSFFEPSEKYNSPAGKVNHSVTSIFNKPSFDDRSGKAGANDRAVATLFDVVGGGAISIKKYWVAIKNYIK